MYIKTIKNHIKIFCFLIVILLTSIKIVAQTTPVDGFKAPDFTPKSPEASAFLRYGEYPVDLSTGVPGISLPIYTIKVDDFEIPISLSYHASGIKVGQEATWVGLGWNLNAGAQIILNSRDDVDENDAEIDNPQRDAAFVKQYMIDHPYAFNNNLIKEYEKSKVKDVYSFSSPTVNGNFYINNGTPVIFPPDAFVVQLGGKLDDGTNVTYFIITDKFGNKYLFKNTIEKSVRALTHNDDYISAWFVDEIRTAKNNKIKFTYQDDGNVIEYSESESIGVTEQGKNCACPQGATQTQVIGQIRNSNENTTTSTKKIKEITFNDDQTKVEFELRKGRLDLVNQNGYLDNIKISQNTTSGVNLVKKVFFEYSYFNADQTGTDAYKYKRLKLNRIFDLNDANEHSFIYSDINLPIKNSKSQDFFGYYNGASNFSLIPEHIIIVPQIKTVGSAKREINSTTIEAGILKEIHYPTKGLTRFNYEANKFYGIDKLNKYLIQKKETSLTGVSSASNPAPPQLEDPGGEGGQNCVSGNCLKYKTINFSMTNPQDNFLTYTVTNNGSTAANVIKYKYCRIFVYLNDLLHDSGKINVNRTVTLPLPLVGGNCTIVLESYGADMRIDASLNYIDENLTPKNVISSGLRVQSVESYDSNNTLLLKKAYEYNDKDNNEISSGKLINDLGVDFISGSFANFIQGVCPLSGIPSDPTIPIPKVDYTKGYYINSRSKQGIESNSVIYRYVKEISTNVTTAEKMYTDYEFTTDQDWFRSDIGIQANLGFRRGKVLEKKDFKTVGSSTFIVRKEKNTYFDDNSKIAYVKGYKLIRKSSIDVNEGSNPQQQPAILSILSDCQVPQSLADCYVLGDYNIPIPWFYQKTSEISNYFYNASNSLTGTLLTTTNYNYSNPAHLQLTSQTTTNSNGEILETKFFYASDPAMVGKPFVNELKAANMIGIPLDTQTLKAGTKTSERLTIYDKSASTGNLLLPKTIYAAQFPNSLTTITNIGTLEKKLTYDLYDDKGNVLQYTPDGGMPVSIIWGYNKTQPIAKIENAAYAQVTSYVADLQTKSDADNDNCITSTCKEQILREALKTFSTSFTQGMVSTYTYNPLVGVTSITDPKGISTYYEYDIFGRLKFVKDKDQNVLQKYCYNYKGQQTDCTDNTAQTF
ncbi:YD repeat-containing protein [Flavobacterium sp. 9]|uniref:hypothetical protein n=1 Tax=Flavobacterium sp. 9 TaxID=2035198 RepID=UPI000C3ED033|nr:hypothetical protein [Flavobacterium sp. 9]PIF33169.1 YD repeat-containing protein [Flavobacterium sp. 9]